MDDLTFFREGTLRICGSLNIDEVLRESLVFLKRFMPLNCIQFSRFDPGAGGMRIIARAADYRLKPPLHAPLSLSAKAQAYIRSHAGEIVILDSRSSAPPVREISAAIGARDLTGIGMPLWIKGERLGLIAVISKSAKPFSTRQAGLLKLLHDPFAIAMTNHLRYREVLHLKELLADDNRYLHRELHRMSGDEIVGEKFGLSAVMGLVRQVSRRDSPVLLLGETGVGKEVIANAIHYASPRSAGPLIKVNCGAIPEGLIDSELFGHEKGAFTGATAMKRGRFERAHEGTIFLDEVGELPPAAQVRLLRVLQERQIERVGGSAPVPVNLRVIAATHRDLERMVRAGEFREDLWYRLNVFPIRIPPLRERRADIPAFVYHFIGQKVREMNLRSQPVLAGGAIERLQQYDWPGNVRELENLVEREMIRAQATGEPLRFEEIAGLAAGNPTALSDDGLPPAARPRDLNSAMRVHILQALQQTSGKIQGPDGAAALLGVNPSTLRHRLRKLGIPFGRIADFPGRPGE
jgi:transcriptional regulator with GAF, ATPase, and Fis domain